jgi:hypothetical protein
MKRLIPLFALALLSVACDRQKPPETDFAFPARPKALIAERVEGSSPFQVMLGLTPGEPRSNQDTGFRFAVRESDRPVRGANVQVSLVMPLMDMGKNEFDAQENATPGVYDATGKFTMGDEWEIIVTVTKDGKKGKHIFNVRVQE